ncbi:MAG: ribonucleoside-triphosphate reductase [Candidatus Frackibacter sp. T328-2]|jgi:ribonucleoside-diphosphate reductase alpha chain/ribonucleoside-triphosphate reductase|nr:MAG: ribonucleoside-triphosphate reductase [Candidatus Frackibacter sp. T328-2]
MMSFIEDGKFNMQEAKRAFELIARAGLRMTMVHLEIGEWSRKQRRDRLVGVSMTGWKDMVEAVGWNVKKETKVLRVLRKVVRDAVDKYADEVGIPKPLLATTVKPEGTWSQLPTVSSGLHYSHSPYYIRRVRINADDPLTKVAESLDWEVKAEVGQEWDSCDTKVIEFPIKSPTNKTKDDITAIEQLENYKMFRDHYAEHNPSVTITVKDDEWEDVEQWIWDNWDTVVGITLLSHSGGNYPLAPYEAIGKEEYEERVKDMAEFKPELLGEFETEEMEFDLENAETCEGGACPVR